MNRAEQPGREPEDRKPGDRLSRLSQAMLRINESLDFDTVLQEVVDGARDLTGSRYGAITVLGEAGQKLDFIVSGLTREEHRGLWEMPQGLGFRVSQWVDDTPVARQHHRLPQRVGRGGGPAAADRASPHGPSEPYVQGDLTIDYAQRLVSVAGEPVGHWRVSAVMTTP